MRGRTRAAPFGALPARAPLGERSPSISDAARPGFRYGQGAMLTENHIKEGLSRAFILAVAHRAGLNCAFQAFDYGLDGTFREVKTVGNRRVESGFAIDFQAKASENCTFEDDFVSYDLEAKSHKDLVDGTVGAPRILIVLALPADKTKWLEVSAESLVLRRSAFWMSLRGEAPTSNKTTQVVKIPRAQVFDVQAVTGMFGRVRAGGLP